MVKRVLDMVLSGFALLILLPFFPLIALPLKLTGEGEIFYVQPRVGKKGRIFGLVKFATMLKDSPNLPGGDITLAGDPRVLPLGHFLRKTKINELPQIWNVLKGDISIVGPRPLTPGNFNAYPREIQREIEDVKPGLTGIGSIVFRDEQSLIARSHKLAKDCYRDDIAPYKGELEVWYKENRSLGLDLLLIFLTAWVIFFSGSNLHERLLKGLPQRPDTLCFQPPQGSSGPSM